jgi:hypothetical protein
MRRHSVPSTGGQACGPQRGSIRIVLVVLVLVVGLIAVGGGTSAPKANRLCVGGPHCYATIQAALNAAHDGDSIRIGPGTFAGGVKIERSVKLVGLDSAVSRIKGGGPVVTIGSATTTPTVTLARLTITGGLTTSNPQRPNCGPDIPTCGPGYADATALGGGIEAFPGTTVRILHSVVTGNRAEPALSTNSVKAICPTGPCPVSFGDAAGIDNWGTMTLIDSTVSDNHAAAVQSNGGGIVDEENASLTLRDSRVLANSASAVAPFGRFVSGGGILVAPNGSFEAENSVIDRNESNLASAIPHPYPLQDGGTDVENSVGGGLFLSEGATATIRNSNLDRNSVSVVNPAGEPFGADAALCACGAALSLFNSTVDGNTLTVNVLTTADSGPSGPTALEADSDTTIRNTRIVRNAATVTAPTGDAATLGAVAFFLDGSTATVANSTIIRNSSTTNAPQGAASIQGAGISNNGPLTLRNDLVAANVGTANGQGGFAQGAGIWNGILFGGPVSSLTLVDTAVTRNKLAGGPGVALQGGGIFTPGFPVSLLGSVVEHNSPDQCYGC